LTAALGGLGALFASRLALPDTAAAAAGDPLLIGNTSNTAGTANTTLTTASTGTALLVTQNGSGTALRGSAVGAGSIAGFFTAANGTGISGVTGQPNSYGVFGSNDDAAAGTGGAIRADGNANDGLVATTDNGGRAAVKASNSAIPGVGVLGTGYIGVHGDSPSSLGVYGTGVNGGVRGDSTDGTAVAGNSSNGVGVRGQSNTTFGVHATSNLSDGVYGSTNSGSGVHGSSVSGSGVLGASSSGFGVRGTSSSNSGVLGESTNGVGVYGFSTNGSAGYFEGLLNANSVNAAIKNFRIDHPQDPARKVLEHSCVESNERLTVYAGTATTDASGEATVELPAWFDSLNTDLRYQLTPLADARSWVKRKVKGNRFTIATSEPGVEVCWQVSGVRQDAYAKAHPLEVEAVKTGKEKGKYLHPVEHGKPESDGVGYEIRETMRNPGSAAG
jgi:hypothetical protein